MVNVLKAISMHSSVLECIEGKSNEFLGRVLPEYYVLLKEGYVFTKGKAVGRDNAHFMTIQEFLFSCPEKIDKNRLQSI